MGVNQEEVRRINDKIIQDSFNTSFYNDAFEKLEKIASLYPDNPAQIEADSDAYISGVTQEMPRDDVEKISKPLDEVKNAYAEQAMEDFNKANLQQADETSMHNTFVSKRMAENAAKTNAPQKVQIALAANFFHQIDDDVKVGRLSVKEAINLRDTYSRNLIINHYGDIARSPNTSIEEKLRWREQFIDGKTGEDVVDKMMTPEQRLDAVMKIESTTHQLEERERQMRSARKSARDDLIERELVQLYKDEQIAGFKGSYEWEKRKRMIEPLAETMDQLKMIQNFDKVWETAPSTKIAISKAKRDGTANEAFYYGLWKEGYIDADTYVKEIDSLDNNLHNSLHSSKGEEIKSRFISVFNYDNFGKNEAYNVAWSAYQDRLAGLDHIATAQEHEDAYKYAMDVAKAFPGDQVDFEQRRQKIDFYRETGFSVDSVDTMFDDSITELTRKRRKNIDVEAEKDLIYAGLFGKINTKVKNPTQTNIIIDKYKKIKGE